MMLDTLSTNFVDFINYTFSTFSIMLLTINFSVIAWIGGLITKFWGNKIFIKTDRVEEI